MNSEKERIPSLREMELEVEAEGREWMRKRLQQKMQEQANRHGGVFPPPPNQGLASAAGNDAAAHGLRHGAVKRVARKKPR
jgi:hypothetical protein